MPDKDKLDNNAEIVEGISQPLWLRELNEAQKTAVTNLNGPLLVLSGAGTGKTRVLTSRLAQLIATRTANPFNILAVTFTNKAAREMRKRAVDLVGPMAEQITLGTFHSVAAQMLRRHAELVGLKSNFTILIFSAASSALLDVEIRKLFSFKYFFTKDLIPSSSSTTKI